MKLRKVLLIVAFATMVVITTGCEEYGKYTGGGWIEGLCGGKATVGFQIKAYEDCVSGQVQYNDHGARVKFHGEVEGILGELVFGTATLQPGGETGYFEFYVQDNGEGANAGTEDVLQVLLIAPSVPLYFNKGNLMGGNIQYHPLED